MFGMMNPAVSCPTVDTVTRAVDRILSKLDRLQLQWKNTDFVFSHLTTQLNNLRRILCKVEEWMDTGSESIQCLSTNLEWPLECCDRLALEIDSQLTKLLRNVENNAQDESKEMFLLSRGEVEECSEMIEQLTTEVNFLFAECDLKTSTDHPRYQGSPMADESLGGTQTDTASMMVHCDRTFLPARGDDRLKSCLKFDFDAKLLGSKVYQDVGRKKMGK
jgi:hypothetical protein